jgi:hypothetical protein
MGRVAGGDQAHRRVHRTNERRLRCCCKTRPL